MFKRYNQPTYYGFDVLLTEHIDAYHGLKDDNKDLSAMYLEWIRERLSNITGPIIMPGSQHGFLFQYVQQHYQHGAVYQADKCSVDDMVTRLATMSMAKEQRRSIMTQIEQGKNLQLRQWKASQRKMIAKMLFNVPEFLESVTIMDDALFSGSSIQGLRYALNQPEAIAYTIFGSREPLDIELSIPSQNVLYSP